MPAVVLDINCKRGTVGQCVFLFIIKYLGIIV